MMNSCRVIALFVLIAVSILGCKSSTPGRSTALQSEIDGVAQYFNTYDSDFESQYLVAEPYGDPVELIMQAMLGDDEALHRLFDISQSPLDGAGAEGYAVWLSRVLHAVGDVRFGEQLSRETGAVQDQVRDYLFYNFGVPEHTALDEVNQRYPITFPNGN
ncbi:MAG: hypothetical protein AB8C95_09425 [Phycisphaeraceae bacterium]